MESEAENPSMCLELLALQEIAVERVIFFPGPFHNCFIYLLLTYLFQQNHLDCLITCLPSVNQKSFSKISCTLPFTCFCVNSSTNDG